MQFLRAAYFVCCFFLPLALTGQTDTLYLPEVEVGISLAKNKLRQVAGSLSVLGAGELEQGGSINAIQQLNTLPGLYIQSGGLNTHRITIRGIGSRTPYSSNRIRAYLNDIPLTNGEGVTIIEDIDVSLIERIEVVKGPSGALYGSGLGGTIRIVTRGALQQPGLKIESEKGTFGTCRLNAGGGFRSKHVYYSGIINQVQSGGFRENSDYKRSSALFYSEGKVGNTALSATLSIVDLKSQIASSLNQNDFREHPEKAALNWFAVRGFEEYRKLLAGISVQQRFSEKTSGMLTLFSGYFDEYESRPFNILKDRALNYGARGKLLATTRTVHLVGGFEWYRERYRWNIFETLQGEQGVLQNKNSENRNYINIFGLAYYHPTEKILLTAGLNLNKLNYSLADHFPGNGDQSGQYAYPLIVSPRIGWNYGVSPKLNLFGAFGHGFSAPSLEETLLPEGEINPELKPEEGYMTELGSRWSLHNQRIFIELTGYFVRLRNLLVTKRITEDTFTGINAGKTRHLGAELLGKWVFANAVGFPGRCELTASATLSHNEFSSFTNDGHDYSGNHLPGIPKSTVSGTMSWRPSPGFFVHAVVQRTGPQFLNDANKERYEAYHTVGLKTGYTLQVKRVGAITWFGSVQNLFDTRYASMILVNAPSFGSSLPRYYYPAPPRHWTIGFQIQL
ncbi:MAG: TonB-dependent receptor [Prolixibacteraceae bacterium]|jgi:iron complex outermembrane receptor protein|nr:TonB-dependent receptor [Prolixibacteraceae bacterium]